MLSQRAGFFDVQAQYDADVAPAPQTYHDLYAAARPDVLNSAPGNPDAITFAGISTAHGTSAQMLAAINPGNHLRRDLAQRPPILTRPRPPRS